MADKPAKPGRLILGDESYVPIVLLIHTKNPDGSPGLMKHIAEDATIELAGGEEFMIAYAPEKMIRRPRFDPAAN